MPPQKPTPAIDLDDLEREGTPDPFIVRFGGKDITLIDAQELEWRDLMAAMSDPPMFFRLIIPADDQEHFFSQDLKAWKLRKLMDTYLQHHGLDSPGNPVALPR